MFAKIITSLLLALSLVGCASNIPNWTPQGGIDAGRYFSLGNQQCSNGSTLKIESTNLDQVVVYADPNGSAMFNMGKGYFAKPYAAKVKIWKAKACKIAAQRRDFNCYLAGNIPKGAPVCPNAGISPTIKQSAPPVTPKREWVEPTPAPMAATPKPYVPHKRKVMRQELPKLKRVPPTLPEDPAPTKQKPTPAPEREYKKPNRVIPGFNFYENEIG